MNRYRRLVMALSIVGALSLAFSAARAEGFADLHFGSAVTPNTDGTAKIGPVDARGTVKFDAGGSIGIRGGYWLESAPWLGFALDVSYFDSDQDDSEPLKLDVFPISALLMLRYPLMKSSDFPRGRLQPYAGVGPGAFVTRAKADLTPLGLPSDFQDNRIDVGVDARAGAAWDKT